MLTLHWHVQLLTFELLTAAQTGVSEMPLPEIPAGKAKARQLSPHYLAVRFCRL